MTRVLWPVVSLATLLLALAPRTPARAEGVGEREKAPSSVMRLRGAAALEVLPDGTLLSIGGAKLRVLDKGGKSWRTLHEVRGDSLYRLDADGQGRLLAVWEQEGVFHLLDLHGAGERSFAKPPAPPGYPPATTFRVEALHFSDDGRAALVYTEASVYAADTGSRDVEAAYRVPLDGKGAPELLFVEEGFPLYQSVRGMALVKPTSWRLGCGYPGCPVASIVSFDIGAHAARKTIFEARGERFDTAQIVRGSHDDRFAVQLGSWNATEKKRHRRLLRYAFGHEPSIVELSDPHEADFEKALYASNGDYIEMRQGEDRTVTVTRVDAAGKESSLSVVPWADRRGRPAKDFLQSFGERAGGALWLHWGDQLVVGDLSAPRKLDVGSAVGRGSEWAGAYIYDRVSERLWMGVEMGGGRDYVAVDLADVDRRARPWAAPSASPDAAGPMPPAVAIRLSGTRREAPLGAGVVSIGETDLYYREGAKQPWHLLYALPDRSIYRLQLDAPGGRILAHWSSERVVHVFEPARGVHTTVAWPTSDLAGLQAGLTNLFFAADGAHALVYMGGLVKGSGPWITEAYQVALDGKTAPARLFRAEGNYLDLSERGATFVLPTKDSAYRCDTATCIVDSISVVDLDGTTATSRVVYRRDTAYVDFARRVPGKAGDELAVVIRYSTGRGPSERALLRFRYGAPGVDKTVLPSWSVDAVKRSYLTEAGDYLEFVVKDERELIIELLGKQGARATWSIPAPRHTEIDAVADRNVYGFGERAGGGYWLHWGDHIVLLRDGQPARAFAMARLLKKRGEWAGADRYTASPERLRIGVDIGAGREQLDLGFATIEKGATVLK